MTAGSIICTAIVIFGIIYLISLVAEGAPCYWIDYSIDTNTGVCTVKNGYKVSSSKEMLKFIEDNMNDASFSQRSAQSYLYEWRAHNLLYELDIFVDRTKDIDFNVDESIFKRIGYFILSVFYLC